MSLTYSITDIHGCMDHLLAMLIKIEEHAAGRTHRIITHGDYIDRGPDSKGVLDVLMTRPDIIKLKGNHEAMLMDALGGNYQDVALFLQNGGDATLKSFGAAVPMHVPSQYLKFINELKLYEEDDLRIYVHAGIDPNATMDRQREQILLWIRSPFLDMVQDFPKYVVHGHTPFVYDPRRPTNLPEAIVLNNRCNIDTGCVFTGKLTCAVFDDSQAKPIDLLVVDMPVG